MNTFDAIESRRSVKQFDPNHEMSSEEIDKLMSLAILSPTAFNIQHWRFVLVREPALRQQLRQAAWNQAQFTDASLLIILCADVQAWQKQPRRYWRNAPKEVAGRLVPMIETYYRGRPQVQRDEAMRSCGIAAQTLMLAAKAMGYDSCPMDGFDFERVGQLIALPEDHLIAMALAVGKPIASAWPRPGQLAQDQVVLTDRFSDKR